ncbi:hypothetical protein [Rhizobium laguerreae]|uniref:hypothetical protein n=1 Tax=Rhizobium laguerreae TaxID=1076926 RepID=UPI001C917DC7|nr:hypothetical protein [Rhizobium laguerreae]MBY3201769.1 site-specific integrase [Rhizobium laguerreae]
MGELFETKITLIKVINKGAASFVKQAVCYNPRDGLVLPINAFLFERRFNLGAAWRTVESDAYSLCVWWDYLHLRRINYLSADVEDLKDFIRSGGTRYGNIVQFPGSDPILNFDETTAAAADTVLAFYRFLKHNLNFRLAGEDGSLGDVRRKFLGRLRSSGQMGDDIEHHSVAYPRSERPKLRYNRPTPSPEEALEVINATLRGHRAFHVQTYYFIAKLFRFSGLRAGGCSSMTVEGFFGAMAVETPFIKAGLKSALVNRQKLAEVQFEIVECLNWLRQQGRTYIFVPVVEKGRAQRLAPVPIELASELVDYILNDRERFIESKKQRGAYQPPDNVFLSNKAGGGGYLTAEAMSNKMALIFRECGIAGSGHRLRATFCESVVRELYLRDRGANGRAWQPDVIIAVARKLLGHMSADAISSYLNNIASNEHAWSGEPILVRDKGDAAIMRGLSDALEGNDGKDVGKELRDWATRMAIPPRDERNLFNTVKTHENG